MSEKAGHDRDGVFDDEDARPGRAPHRDDGWREQGYRRDGDVPEQVPADPGLFTHALESSALVVAAALLIAWAVPHAVSWQLLTLGMACITAVTFWTAVRVTGSLFLSGYLLTWGVFLTAWLTWERFAGPWHEIVLGGLFIPAAVLAPAGAVAVGHHKEAVERARRTDADRAAARELRRWERILDRHGAPGCTVLDVRELRDGGMEVRGRLGKATDSRRAITYDTLCQAAPEIAVSQRSDRDGAYFSQPPDASAADFILHVRPKRHGERPAVHLPMEDRPLTVNRPMGFGVLDNGREYRLLLREVCVLIIGVRDAGKALSTDTPLATPSGWTTMGEIQAGDQVFDEAGQPCTVLAATGVLHGRPCYEIEFSDGTKITADANHGWRVRVPALAEPAVLTTKRLDGGLYGHRDIMVSNDERGRHVTAIRPVPSVPVKCLQVDSPSHLYLAGDSLVPTHNSNLINVFLSNLAGCVDSVIWFVDMKGGRTARPWLIPWLQGFAARPVIDWVATTRPEAKLLLETALIAGDHRARTDTSFEKITPTADKPAIFIVCDDVSKLFGHDTVTRNEGEGKISNYGLATQGSQLVELYRSEAIDLVGAGQRLVNDLWGTTGIKSQAEVRFGLRVTDAGEGSRIFPDYPAAAKRLAHLRDPGSAVVKDRDGVSPAIQLYRVGSEERIRRRALWAGDPDSCLRPELEPDLVTALGPAYAERWTRPETADLLDTWRRAANIAPEPEPGAETDAEFGRIIAHMESDPEKAVDPRRARAREIVRESGIHGITVGRVLTRLEAEGMTAVRETVQRWFANDEEHGMMRRGQHGSRLWRWVNFGPDDD